MADSNPLNEDHLQAIKTGLRAVEDARSQLAKAKAAGIDVAADESTINELGTKLRRIGNVYFPGKVQ